MLSKKILIIILSLLLVSCGKDNTIKLATGSTGGTYYPVGSAIAEMLSDNMSEYNVNSYTGNASVANSNLFLEKATDMALVQSNVAFWAYSAKGMFEENPVDSIRGISSLYSEAIHIIVRSDSNIKSISDLRNKRVNIGAKGSGNYFDAMTLLNSYNIFEADISPFYDSFAETVEKMQNNEIDAAFITSGIPTTSVILMGSHVDIELISIDEDKMEILKESQPYYTVEIIPGKTYPGIEYDVSTLAVKALLVCDENISEELIYDITKTFWENSADLVEAHEKGKEIAIKSALEGMSIPLHSGALKYYKEVGFDVQN